MTKYVIEKGVYY